MARIAVAHHTWNLGGETEFNVKLIYALCKLNNYIIDVISVSKPSKPVESNINENSCVDKIISIIPFNLEMFIIYQKLALYRIALYHIRHYPVDIIWIDNHLYKPLIKDAKRRKIALVEYIHFPYEVLNENLMNRLPEPVAKEINEYLIKYRRSTFWSMYLRLWARLSYKLNRGDPFAAADIVLSNSAYVAKIIKMLWNEAPLVLHPPVDIEMFSRYRDKEYHEREESIVMVGRISPEKKYELVIEAVSISETKPKLRIIGSLTKSNLSYARKLKSIAKKKNVNLKFNTNVSRFKLVKLLWNNRAYIHTAIGEHYGISVVEAMASGLPVIVHKSGGPYIDIIEKGKYGLYYEDIEELSRSIDSVMGDNNTWRRYHRLSIERAMDFSFNVFLDKISGIMAKINLD